MSNTQSPDTELEDTLAQMQALKAGAQDPQVTADPATPPAEDPPAEEEKPAEPVKAKGKARAGKAAAKLPETVRFMSRDPGLRVLLGEGRDIQFDEGVAEVPLAMVSILENHHLYLYDHISRADETIRINGRTISFKGDPNFRAQAEEARQSNGFLFYFDAPRGAPINLGDTSVVFDSGRAIVQADIAARLRRHRFFVEGRLVEIPV